MNRRQFLATSFAVAGAASLPGYGLFASGFTSGDPMASKLPGPITRAEREDRIERAQALMSEQGLDAVLIEPGASMDYFSGLKWWRSERLTALVIPRRGKPGVVTPFFERPSVAETLNIEAEIRTWHEDENPYALVKGLLQDRGMTRSIGFEPSVRYFIADGLKKAGYGGDARNGASVTAALRMVKSDHEIALMKQANRITLEAYGEVIPTVTEGDTPATIGARMKTAMTRRGGERPWTLILIGQSSAFPHGTSQAQIVREDDVVLMDCGCGYQGYQADISRTFVYGTASDEQRRLWDLVRQGQEIVFDTAQVGVPAGQVDDAVRQFYEKQGFGPDYVLPGLSHRTGHGIGMEGHEPINFVRGEKTVLMPGMCFSNEPGLYDPAKFGVRLEDCLYMTEDGARWFTEPPGRIEDRLGQMGR